MRTASEGRLLGYVLAAAAMSMYIAAASIGWLHLTQGPPSQQVNIRWSPNVSPAERVRAEGEHGLADAVLIDGRTWGYVLRRRTHADIERLISDPRVQDTFHIDRGALRVQLDRPELSPRTRAWLETDWLGYTSLALVLLATLLTWYARRSLFRFLLTLDRLVTKSVTRLEAEPYRAAAASRSPREPGSRASRIVLGAVVVTAPAIMTCVLLDRLFHATLFDYLPLVSDEIAYQRQIAAFVAAGFNGGYFTTYEQPAPWTFTHFSVHGPAFPIIYGLVGRFVGWQLYSGPIFNLAVLAVAIACFLMMARLSRWQILLTGGVIITSWWVALMAAITMQESLNQAFLILMAGFAARLLNSDTTRRGVWLLGALAILAVGSVLRPTNWIVAVPLVIVGMASRRKQYATLALLGAAAGIPLFWLVWRYISAPIPGLAIEWGPTTRGGALRMITAYFLNQLRSNAHIFNLTQLGRAPFAQHVMFEAAAISIACAVLMANAKRRSAAPTLAFTVDGFNLLTLGMALVAFLGFYFDSEASISRVTAPFVLLALLLFVATRVHTWLVVGVMAANLLVAPSFLTVYRDWRGDTFPRDRSRFEQFQAQLAPVLRFDPRRSAWCNTLLTTTYAREIVAVPAGVGLSVGERAEKLRPPIKSGYVLLTANSVKEFGDKARLQHLATTVLGDLYANRDAHCG